MAESIIRLEIEVKGRLDVAKAKTQRKLGKHFTHSEFVEMALDAYEEAEKELEGKELVINN